MHLRTIHLFILTGAGALASLAQDSVSWRTDPQHPGLQYRVKCRREAATVEWRNGYPGALSFKASIKSMSSNDTYDGAEDVTVAPGAITDTGLETMYCSPTAFDIRVTRFSMAAPPAPAPPARPSAPVVPGKPLAQPPLVSPYVPPVDDLPKVSADALASIRPGMRQEDVEQKLGQPASKVTIPESGEFIETYRYVITTGGSGLVRFSNGIVSAVTAR